MMNDRMSITPAQSATVEKSKRFGYKFHAIQEDYATGGTRVILKRENDFTSGDYITVLEDGWSVEGWAYQ